MKTKIPIFDYNFAHAPSVSHGNLGLFPSYFEWDRDLEDISNCPIIVFSETFCSNKNAINVLKNPNIKAKKILWLIEPRSVFKNIDSLVYNFHNYFDLILTYDDIILSQYSKTKKYYLGGCWILPEDRKIYEKHKNISLLFSNKKTTQGQALRHVIYSNSKGIDGYGGGCGNLIDTKLPALENYRFSVIIENHTSPYYFSEKLIDAFQTGTIPIYYGSTHSVCDIFDQKGILDIEVLSTPNAISNIDWEKTYHKRIDAVLNNFKISKQYTSTEDWLWLHCFNEFYYGY